MSHQSPETAVRAAKRNPAPVILGLVLLLLVVYYLVVAFTGVLSSSTDVPTAGKNNAVTSQDYLTLQMKVQDVDLSNRVIQANVLPIAHGALVGAKAGEINRSLRIEVASAGLTTSVVSFPGKSIVDPTSVSLTLDRGDTAYPFDRPFADFTVSVQDDATGAAIPFVVKLENSARPWTMSSTVESPRTEETKTLFPVELKAHRDALSVLLVSFYVLAILLTTLMAVVTVGSALVKRQLEFSNVIWLSATMISFPALRSAMPGAPPIGTALDFIVFFPCITLIAGMLLWTGAHLLWRESAILRRRDFEDDGAGEAESLEAIDG